MTHFSSLRVNQPLGQSDEARSTTGTDKPGPLRAAYSRQLWSWLQVNQLHQALSLRPPGCKLIKMTTLPLALFLGFGGLGHSTARSGHGFGKLASPMMPDC
ncbi:hypothetical protein ACJJIL_20745 [Microbulbifer sp. EKSA005]|uniref:hypothetical protein n=1 Tax=Microbulbifer sp. EKSA005 TaxID=3243364 RepID=UPI0040437A2C